MRELANRKWSFPAAVLSAGSTSTYTTGVTVNSINRGKYGTALTNQTTQATPTTDARTGAAFPVVPLNYGTVIVMGIVAAGTIVACQGTVTKLLSDTVFLVAPEFPPLPEDFVPIGYYVVKNGTGGANWIFGASYWNASGITVTATSCSELPDRPQIA